MDQNMMMFLLLYLLLQRQNGQTGAGAGTSSFGGGATLLPTMVGFSNAPPAVRGIATYTAVRQIDDERAKAVTETEELHETVTSLEAKVAELETAVKDCDTKWAEAATQFFNFCVSIGVGTDKMDAYPRLLELYKQGTPPNF